MIGVIHLNLNHSARLEAASSRICPPDESFLSVPPCLLQVDHLKTTGKMPFSMSCTLLILTLLCQLALAIPTSNQDDRLTIPLIRRDRQTHTLVTMQQQLNYTLSCVSP